MKPPIKKKYVSIDRNKVRLWYGRPRLKIDDGIFVSSNASMFHDIRSTEKSFVNSLLNEYGTTTFRTDSKIGKKILKDLQEFLEIQKFL